MVKWGVLQIISLTVGVAGIVIVTLLYTLTGGKVPFDYGVVIDAGSSHTQMTTYKWEGDKERGTGLVRQVASCYLSPGLSDMMPEEAAKSLTPCLTNITSSIPSEKWSSTPLALGATAGMRLLNVSKPYEALATMIAVRCLLEKSGLNVKRVEILSGEVEGVSAWVTVNFLQEIIQNQLSGLQNTIGALDMGGASTQFSSHIPDDLNVTAMPLKLYGNKYQVYSRSYLCFGVQEAYRRYTGNLIKDLNSWEIIKSPCLPEGYSINYTAEYLFDQPCTTTHSKALWLFEQPERKSKNFTFIGTSESKNCSLEVLALVDQGKCQENYTYCFDPPDIKIPLGEFMAFSSYYYTTHFMNSTNSTMNEFKNATEEFCAKNMTEIEDIPTDRPDLRPKFCFQANLIINILAGYGFNDTTWSQINFVEKVKDVDVGWSLGYMIIATTAIPEEKPTPPEINLTVYILLMILFTLALLMSFVFMKFKHKESIVYETI